MPTIIDHCQGKAESAGCRLFFRRLGQRWRGGFAVVPLQRIRAALAWTRASGRFKWDEYRLEPEAGRFFHADATADKVAAASASVKAIRQAAARKAVATRRARLAVGQAAD